MAYKCYLIVLICIFSFSKADQEWPEGNYSLPMSVYGCPDKQETRWKYGYLNITFNRTIDLYEYSSGRRIGWNDSKLNLIDLMGPYGSRSVQLNFCSRVTKRNNSDTVWPKGQYGIYGVQDGCPLGFETSLISIPVPYIVVVNKDGFLPEIHVGEYGNHSNPASSLRFRICQKHDNKSLHDEDLDVSTILLSHNESSYNISDTVLHKKLFIERKEGNKTWRYDWISYYTRPPQNHTVNEVNPDYLGLSGFTDEDTWILYDIGISAVIDGISIWGELTNQHKLKISPAVYVSDMKWSFLRNGANLCLPDVFTSWSYYNGFFFPDWILIKCLNSPVGRFITLTFPRQENNNMLRSFFYSVRLVQFNTVTKSPRCNRPLGMGDGAILDSQLSASSYTSGKGPDEARPYKWGWCSYYFDIEPYFQVDFVATVRVEGIQLYNTETTDAYYNGGRGHFTVSIEHGITPYSLHRLPQDFRLDPFLPAAHVQTVRFASPLETRILRIHPRQLTGSVSPMCLRFEVIGCQISDPFSRICKANRNTEWFPVKEAYLPHLEQNKLYTSNSSTAIDCVFECDAIPECFAISFNKTSSGACEIYLRSDTYSYRHAKFDRNTTEAYIGICDTAEYLEAKGGYISSFIDLSWGDKTREEPGILVSQGYPLYYPSSATLLWTIKFDKGQFINLLFSNFSLNDYKFPPGKNSNYEDTMYLYPYPRNTSHHLYGLVKYLETGTLEHHPYDSMPTILTKSMNNRQFSFNIDANVLQIVFKTFFSEQMSEQHRGVGLRLIAFASDLPTCLHWGFHVSVQEIGCHWQEATLMSTSFAGLFFENSEINMWFVMIDTMDYVKLEITDFDVGCETGTVFEITDLDSRSRYCNLNRPSYPIVSTLNSLHIKFHTRQCNALELVEGFKGRYAAISQNESISLLASSEKIDEDIFQQNTVTVCSETFNKCYVLLDLEEFNDKRFNKSNIGWNYTMSGICGKHGWDLLSLHSKKEQTFVGFYLQHRLQSVTRRNVQSINEYYGYTYLGLRRTAQGKHIWSDGSPVTFTAWAPGQPSGHVQLSCARFNIKSLSADITWESIPCGIMMAEFGVCEYPMTRNKTISIEEGDKNNAVLENTLNQNDTDIEMSVYYQCGFGEIISILGRCDGKRDCASGADEENCETSDRCGLDQFRCNDGKCLDISLLCDFHTDCLDGEDEACDFPDCPTTSFRCNNNQCIKGSLRCDGKTDCLSGEDEDLCSSCNPATSFDCGDFNCIPLSYQCDGVPDCRSEEDEKSCPTPNSCQEWYNAGFRENGIFKIHGENMECVFDEILSEGKLVTKYHSIDFVTKERKREIGTLYLEYGSLDLVEKMRKYYDCYQSVDQLCQPWIQELYEVDRNGTGGQNHRCHCLRWTQSLTQSTGYYESCNGEATTESEQLISFKLNNKPYIERLDFNTNYYGYSPSDFEDVRIRINPVTCYSAFKPPRPDIVCGNGITAPIETKCLYNTTEYGTIQGCRNLAHLQNCENVECPDGFFKCPSSFCLERRFLCDGEKHCGHGEDEFNCGETCFEQYRCLQSNVCLSLDYLCDGSRQCPLGDDERFCNFRCPEGCTCKGMAVNCTAAADKGNSTSLSNNTKAIDISSNPGFFYVLQQHSKGLFHLSFLNMSSCDISEINNEFFLSMRNLLVLDISYNNLRIIRSDMFINQHKLNNLFLAGNAEMHIIEPFAFQGLQSLKYFELKYVHLQYLSNKAFHSLRLNILDLSYNSFDYVDNKVFENMHVESIYLNGTKIKSFQKAMFHGMKLTKYLVTDDHKFCCIRPGDVPEENCYPHKNEFSSCSDLMRNDALRALLWIIGLFALLGNSASLIYRFVYDRERLKLGYGIFVTNLAVADFFMGIYLIIIAGADMVLRGKYIFEDETWRFSIWCKLAGILSTVSSEASVLFICLITLDRIFVIKYPFGQVRFTTTSAIVSSCLAWMLVIVIGILPVAVTSYFEDSFYSKTGVCLALPLTRDRPAGWVYSISIFIGFNFITFLAIAFGQWIIYRTINKARSKMRSFSTARSNDLRVARNLLFVASTDFLCWFPVGILGILALTNHVIPGEVYAWTAVLVLPINSALNPFLYTLSAILGRTKFSPDTSEQSRTQVTSIDVIERHYEVWNCKLFVQSSLATHLLPLTSNLKQNHFMVEKALFTTVSVARALVFLHDRDVSTSEISLQKILLRPTTKGTFAVLLSLTPKMILKDSEKSEDIKKFGKVLDAILKRCSGHSDKNVPKTI